MPKGYTTKTRIENYLLINIDASFNDQINDWIEEVEAYIEQQTGRVFVAEAEDSASTRRFDGDNTCKLLIDDTIAIETIKLSDDSDALETTDFVTYPPNAQSLTKKVPISMVKLIAGVFPAYPPQSISIKARWGYSESVPADIRNAATVLVAGIINYSWNAEGEVKSESIGRYSVTYKDEKQWSDFERLESVLQSYQKYSF